MRFIKALLIVCWVLTPVAADEATIEWQLDHPAKVSAAVYDQQGRLASIGMFRAPGTCDRWACRPAGTAPHCSFHASLSRIWRHQPDFGLRRLDSGAVGILDVTFASEPARKPRKERT